MNINDFTVGELTAAINKIPRRWGRIGELGIFSSRPLATRDVVIEEQSSGLALLPDHEWGGEGTKAGASTRRTLSFRIKQTVHEDFLHPSDVMGIRAFGQDAGMSSVNDGIALKLQRMRAKHDQTLEWKRFSAIKGVVTDGAGTVLYDLYQHFGVTQASVDFTLGTSTTNIRAKCEAVVNQIEDNLMGDTMTGVHVFVSPEFWGKLVTHPQVVDYIKNTPTAQQFMASAMNQIQVYGVVFEQYRASVNGQRFIAANEGHAIPVGTTDTFATYFAPADFNETVNTVALPFYAKTWPQEGDRGYVLHTQSNSLPLCHQPAALVKVFTSN
ncbi:major capsid protein [Tepidimonas taiwanensis]|uniref:Phage major capsid protein E n=1 Tax=Tepidimonas taiwanensis TaxID=307486 RepID=A0A554XAY8_9BURK|nr:major capsid protein [Tepidimonas taiwanensis]TSE33002.1 Phage major capsid protein E [Tepidimonas taiwanensis]UBQ04462.1 major capsid protein [Tepidimonas taiwanensis]